MFKPFIEALKSSEVAKRIAFYICFAAPVYLYLVPAPLRGESSLIHGLLALFSGAIGILLAHLFGWLWTVGRDQMSREMKKKALQRKQAANEQRMKVAVETLDDPQKLILNIFLMERARELTGGQLWAGFSGVVGERQDASDTWAAFSQARRTLQDQKFIDGPSAKFADDESYYWLRAAVFDLLNEKPYLANSRNPPRVVARLEAPDNP